MVRLSCNPVGPMQIDLLMAAPVLLPGTCALALASRRSLFAGRTETPLVAVFWAKSPRSGRFQPYRLTR